MLEIKKYKEKINGSFYALLTVSVFAFVLFAAGASTVHASDLSTSLTCADGDLETDVQLNWFMDDPTLTECDIIRNNNYVTTVDNQYSYDDVNAPQDQTVDYRVECSPTGGAAEDSASDSIYVDSAYCSTSGNTTSESVTEQVSLATYSLDVLIGDGSGTVTSTPGNIDCPGTCSDAFDDGTSVELTANPDDGYAFNSWDGACSGTGSPTCTITMDGPKSTTANFDQIIEATLNVESIGASGVSITQVGGSPSGMDGTTNYSRTVTEVVTFIRDFNFVATIGSAVERILRVF